MIDNDADEVFTSICGGMGTHARTAYEEQISKETVAIAKRLELAEDVLDLFCEDEGGSVLETNILQRVLLWETARAARYVYTDEITWVITSGRAGLNSWFKEYGYDQNDNEFWRRMEPNEQLTIHCDSNGYPDLIEDPGSNTPITKTVAEWLVQVKWNGLLCGEEVG